MTFEQFDSNQHTIDAVMRNFIVIGEAVRHVPDTVKSDYPEISWREIQDFRNFMVHDYLGISNTILWKTIQSDIPLLKEQFEQIQK